MYGNPKMLDSPLPPFVYSKQMSVAHFTFAMVAKSALMTAYVMGVVLILGNWGVV